MHGFLHKGTLLHEFDEGRASKIILKALAATTTQFVASSLESAKHSELWVDDIESYLSKSSGAVSLLNLKVLTLWANYQHLNGDMQRTFMLVSLAARQAYSLQLNLEPICSSPSEAESRRRLMWNLHILDRHLSGTVDEFSLCSRHLETLKLPCDETSFLADRSAETVTMLEFQGQVEIPNISSFAAFVGLFAIWHEILL